MNSEFFAALDLLEKEKGISKDYMLERTEAALLAAFKKEIGNTGNARIVVDKDKKEIKVYQLREIVEEVVDPASQISLEEAKQIRSRSVIGGTLETEVKTKNFRRLSAHTAKQMIKQAIKEAEKELIAKKYESKKEEVITATVQKVDPLDGTVVVDTGTSIASLVKSEQIPNEVFEVGDHIKVYVTEVSREQKGPLVTLSRTHPFLVKRLFELDVPEIQDGTVVIKSISREAGSRTKMAVMSKEPSVDPVGACIGNRGMRINAIVDELNGEKIDIIPYSENPEEYVAAALSPAEIRSVEFDGERSCKVYVSPDQLSLAIGKSGQNARLAARLTGIKIDIKSN